MQEQFGPGEPLPERPIPLPPAEIEKAFSQFALRKRAGKVERAGAWIRFDSQRRGKEDLRSIRREVVDDGSAFLNAQPHAGLAHAGSPRKALTVQRQRKLPGRGFHDTLLMTRCGRTARTTAASGSR